MVNKTFTILLLFTFIFLSTNLISAQQEDIRFYHELGTNLTIFEKCRIDGAICDSGYTCNLSIVSTSQQLVKDNFPMIRGNVYYNGTLNITETNTNGIYEATVDCTNSTSSGSNTFFYQITPNGSPPMDTSQGIMFSLGVLLIVAIATLSAFLSYKLSNGFVSLAFISFAVMLMIFAFGMILNLFELSFGTFSTIINNYSVLYIALIGLVSVGVIGLIIYLIVFALKLYLQDRGIIGDGID